MVTSPVHAQLVQRAATAFQRQAWDEAQSLAHQVVTQFGDDANALMILGVIQMERGDALGAIDFLERGRDAMPGHIHLLVNLGAAYRSAGRLHEARIALEAALQIDRRFAIAHNNLGNVLLDLGDREGAKKEYERAVVAQPNYVEPVAGLARIAEEEHRLDDARRLSDRALGLAPQNGPAQLIRARVALRQDEAAKAAAMLDVLLKAGGATVTNRVVAEGYLGEAFEKLERYDDAFAAFTRANALQHAQHAQTYIADSSALAPATVARMTEFIASADVDVWREGPPLKRPAPVFLVGFPRSGTTLLDQVLASHPQITTLEERDTLLDAIDALITNDARFSRWAALPGSEIERLRDLYWQQVDAGLLGKPVKGVFVDKLPLNAVFLPIVYRLFPTAKVIVAVRDPRDVVLSCYQQRFGMNAAMFQLLKLDTAAGYYDRVMQLVTTCRSKLPLAFHEARYESLINDFDTTVQEVLSFLGLPWDDAVRGYAETAKTRAIGTPSAAQVVKPLYTSSSGKWQKYRRFLEPQLPALEPWVARFGYAPS